MTPINKLHKTQRYALTHATKGTLKKVVKEQIRLIVINNIVLTYSLAVIEDIWLVACSPSVTCNFKLVQEGMHEALKGVGENPEFAVTEHGQFMMTKKLTKQELGERKYDDSESGSSLPDSGTEEAP